MPPIFELIGAANAGEVRPIERVFIGDPGVSEAVYRLLRAAREGRRLEEEVRVGNHGGEAGRWLRMRVRRLGGGPREAGLTVWSVADVTREFERQENVFQELQNAIDYLDHAPAGFFSVDPSGGEVNYLNATLAEWLDYDLAQIGSGGLKLEQLVAGQGAALLTMLSASPGEVKTEILDLDLKTRGGRTLPVRLLTRSRSAATGCPAPPVPLCSTARVARARIRSGSPKCASCASFTTRRWPLPPSTSRDGSCAPMHCSPGCSARCSRARLPTAAPFSRSLPSAIVRR